MLLVMDVNLDVSTKAWALLGLLVAMTLMNHRNALLSRRLSVLAGLSFVLVVLHGFALDGWLILELSVSAWVCIHHFHFSKSLKSSLKWLRQRQAEKYELSCVSLKADGQAYVDSKLFPLHAKEVRMLADALMCDLGRSGHLRLEKDDASTSNVVVSIRLSKV